MRTKIIAIISFLFISAHANAMMFVEPSFAYTVSGTNEVKTVLGGTNTVDLAGYSGVLKLGWTNAGFAIGAVGKRELTEETASGSTLESWYTRYGAFIGYSLPIMLEFGVTYLLPIIQHSDSSYSGYTWSTLAFGVSYSIIPFVKLQVTYGMSMSPQVVTNGTASDLASGTEVNVNNISVGLGVPIPLGF